MKLDLGDGLVVSFALEVRDADNGEEGTTLDLRLLLDGVGGLEVIVLL